MLECILHEFPQKNRTFAAQSAVNDSRLIILDNIEYEQHNETACRHTRV